MARRLLAVAVVLVLLAGCNRPAPSTIAPSAPGDYPQGSVITLASGNRLTVPGGWTAQLTSPGALTKSETSLPLAVPGATLYLAPPVSSSTVASASLMAMSIWVYDSRTAFEEEQSGLRQKEQDIRDGAISETQEVDGVESPVKLSAQTVRWQANQTNLTAYIVTHTPESRISQYEITVLAQTPGRDSAVFEFLIRRLPAEFESASIDNLPGFVMDFVGFQ